MKRMASLFIGAIIGATSFYFAISPILLFKYGFIIDGSEPAVKFWSSVSVCCGSAFGLIVRWRQLWWPLFLSMGLALMSWVALILLIK